MAFPPEPELDELYRELILDHYRSPRNHEPLDSPDVVAEGYNPLCGDEIEIQINFAGDAIDEIAFRGHGCSISQASASMLTTTVKGKSTDEARALIESFKRMMMDADSEPPEELGDLEAFQGVAKFPVRVKCATLAWHALEDGLSRRDGQTEGQA